MLSKRSIKIKSLINDEVCLGTYGQVELELIDFDEEILNLQDENEKMKLELITFKTKYYQNYNQKIK